VVNVFSVTKLLAARPIFTKPYHPLSISCQRWFGRRGCACRW